MAAHGRSNSAVLPGFDVVKVLVVSKALVRSAYRNKLQELTALGADVIAVVPRMWRDGHSEIVFEDDPAPERDYSLIVSPMRWNGHFHLHYYPELPRILDRVRPDILHMDEEPYNLATFHGVRAAQSRGIPKLFFTWQNIDRRYPPPFSWVERAVYRYSNHALAGSDEAAQVLRRKGFDKPITVVPQFGIDPIQFAPTGHSPRSFTVGYLNRLVPAKAPIITLQAFARLPDDCRLLMVGDGPMQQEVRAEIFRLNVANRVELRASVPSSEVPALMKELDVVLLPSLTTTSWKEQFGRVLIEAMASGIPVIGSDSGEIPAVIGPAGLIVPEGNVNALSAAMMQIRSDPDLRVELGVKGRNRVLERYTHASIARQSMNAYRNVLTTGTASV